MFKLIREQEIKSLEITYQEFEHEETKARHIHLKANDNENSFVCGIRTVPEDDNGVMHILEHTLLKSSKNFKAKNLITALRQRTIPTYLNAFTSKNYTDYVISSQYKKSFFDLIEVFTDAVFFPTLSKESFQQEGWRYEFSEPENPDSDLKINGIVYNESKGVFSNICNTRNDEMLKCLYAGTPLSYASVGDPDYIPTLSHEKLKEFHSKYYHPSNAIFLTYGDIPAQETQTKLEEFILNKFEYKEIEVDFGENPKFTEIKNITKQYPINKKDDYKNNSYFKVWDIGSIYNPENILALQLFYNILSNDSSCIMRRGLEELNIANSIFTIASTNSRDIFLGFGAEGIKDENIDTLDKKITEILEDIAENGLDQEDIEKASHTLELDLRTAKKGTWDKPRGMQIIVDMLIPASYNADPFWIIDIDRKIEKLRELKNNPEYFKEIAKKHFLNNSHGMNLTYKGSKELYDKKLKAEKQKLEDIKNNMSKDDIQQILNDNKNLKTFQNSPENLDHLPSTEISDVPQEKDLKKLEIKEYNGKDLYAFSASTTGLTYIKKIGMLKDVMQEDLPYIRLLFGLASNLGFGKHSYNKANTIKNSVSSGIFLTPSLIPDTKDSSKCYITVELSTTALHENISKVKNIMDDFSNNLRFDEPSIIRKKVKNFTNFSLNAYFNEGTSYALDLSGAKFSKQRELFCEFSGLKYVEFLKDLEGNIDNDECLDFLIYKLENVYQKVKSALKESILVVIDSEENLEKNLQILCDDTIVSKLEKNYIKENKEKSDFPEVYLSKSNINYCSYTIKAVSFDHELSGAMEVLSRIIGRKWLHKKLREEGGAYTGSSAYSPSEEILHMYSYRDPEISKTFKFMKETKQWIQNPEILSEQNITDAILLSVSLFDIPNLKVSECFDAVDRFISGRTNEELIEYRKKILNTTKEQLEELINNYILPNFNDGKFAAIVNKTKYEEENLDFKTIEL